MCLNLCIPTWFLGLITQGRALLDWHRTSRFCGHCGERTVPVEAGLQKECSNHSCKLRIFPRVDPVRSRSSALIIVEFQHSRLCINAFGLLGYSLQVVIMLVIDTENDRALLSRQSRYVPRKWSCLAGFMEVPFFVKNKNDRSCLI